MQKVFQEVYGCGLHVLFHVWCGPGLEIMPDEGLKLDADRLLKQHGLRLTRQRREIVDTFLATEGYLSPEEVYSEISRRGIPMDVSTVYRNMKTLVDGHILRRVDVSGAIARYELICKADQHHHYLVCESCGRAVGFQDCSVGEIEENLARRTKFQIKGHHLQVTGICPECQESSDTDSNTVTDAKSTTGMDPARGKG